MHYTRPTVLASMVSVTLLTSNPVSASISDHLMWLPRHLPLSSSFDNFNFFLKRQTTTTPAPTTSTTGESTFNIPTAVFNANLDQVQDAHNLEVLPVSIQTAAQDIGQKSVTNVNTGVVVDKSGAVISGTPAQSPATGDGFAQIVDASGKLILEAAPDGNLKVTDIGATGGGLNFPMVSGTISQDDQDRTLFYYPTMMKSQGVSRIRLADETQIPKGSQLISLVPIDQGDGSKSGTYIASDGTETGNFILIACTYVDPKGDGTGPPAKIFLAQDGPKGVVKLKDPAVQTTITGAAIQDCSAMPYTSPGFGGIVGT